MTTPVYKKPLNLLILIITVYSILMTILIIVWVERPWLYRDFCSSILGSTGEIDPFYQEMRAHLRRLDRNVAPESVLFLGSSSIQGLDVGAVTQRSVNMGIGGDTSVKLLERVRKYRSLSTARGVVLGIGFNDLKHGTVEGLAANIEQILDLIPRQAFVVLSGIQSAADTETARIWTNLASRVTEANARLRSQCNARSNCAFIDLTAALTTSEACSGRDVYEDDGYHLNARGYRCWQNAIKAAIAQLESSG